MTEVLLSPQTLHSQGFTTLPKPKYANYGITSDSRGFSRRRILQLSTPKESKQIWITKFGPKLYWGDQDMMWPPSKATLNAQATSRVVDLATAKKDFQYGTNRVNLPEFMYSCGRNSVLWNVSEPAKRAVSTARVGYLAKPKTPPQDYLEHRHYYAGSCGRVSPIWKVSPGALRSPDRPRTAMLSLPKEPHPQYVPNREVETFINPKALKSHCTHRVRQLARPKTSIEGPFNDSGSPEATIWMVSGGARASTASPRVMELSKHKGFSDGYVANRNVQWPVSRAARKANYTPRIEELASPIIRASMDHVQFNPDAFIVSPTAMKARCSQRVEELAHPIQR